MIRDPIAADMALVPFAISCGAATHRRGGREYPAQPPQSDPVGAEQPARGREHVLKSLGKVGCSRAHTRIWMVTRKIDAILC